MTKRFFAALGVMALALLSPRTTPGQDSQTAVLKVFDGDTAIVIDQQTRQGNRLTVRTDSVGKSRFDMLIELTSEQAITQARVRVWPEGQTAPDRDVTATVKGKKILWGHTGAKPEELKVPKGTLIFIPPSPTAIEQVIRRAQVLRGSRDTVSMKLWTPYQTKLVHDAEVRFPAPGSAELHIFDSVYTLSIDDKGNILSGRIDPEGNTITRE